MRDTLFLIGFLSISGVLLYLGRDFLHFSTFLTWSLAFGGTTAAAVLVVSLYRVQLQLRASRHELALKEAEISFANEVQQALFPRTLPRSVEIDFAAFCLPARGISGDYYDVLSLEDGRLIFAFADISGKGISAAILMANLQAVLRTLIESGHPPSEVVSRLNRHLVRFSEGSRFATVFYGEWMAPRRRLSYINAGHNPPILFGACQGRELTDGGLPVGLFPQVEYSTGEICLQAGDLMALYSDGVTEAVNGRGEEFGTERLRRLLEENREAELDVIKEKVRERLERWIVSDPQDDMTLLLVRAVPPGKEIS